MRQSCPPHKLVYLTMRLPATLHRLGGRQQSQFWIAMNAIARVFRRHQIDLVFS